MSSVAIASSSRISADAGLRTAANGGNAVDAAIAATLVSLTTETAVASLGGGAFVTVSLPDGAETTIDGYVAVPGRGRSRDAPEPSIRRVECDYGGGLRTTVGFGSIATPGALAALHEAWRRHGRAAWPALVEPARRWAEGGFPLTAAAHRFLSFSHEAIYGWHPETRRILHDAGGRLLEPGDTVHVPGLARSLAAVAGDGPAALYGGELGARIAGHVAGNGGTLTAADLASYRARTRKPLAARVDGWKVATNPSPAVGGTLLTAMLRLMEDRPRGRWSPDEVARLVRVQRAVLDLGERELASSRDPARDLPRILEEPAYGDLRRSVRSPSTIHTSAVDAGGRACAITASTGYGSGVVAPGTGIFLNNCLGEHELNPRGVASWPVGARLPSNMAPTIARAADGSVLAVGSPGADRITTAILQTLLNFLRLDMDLEAAVSHPRLHVEGDGTGQGRCRVAHEPGVALDGLDVACRPFQEPSMFFGGVAAALWRPDSGFSVASDPRREGGCGVHLEDGG